MPYRRKKTYRKPRGRRVLAPRTRQAVTNIAKKQIRKLSEWKNSDHYVLPAGQSTAGSTYDLGVVAQSDFSNGRDGNQIQPSSMTVRYSWDVGDESNICRVIIFQWFQDTTPVVSDILNDIVNLPWLSPYKVINRGQYKILHDRIVDVHANKPIQTVTAKLRLSKRKIVYQLVDGTAGKNKPWVLVISDSTAVVHPSFTMYTRMNYRDG